MSLEYFVMYQKSNHFYIYRSTHEKVCHSLSYFVRASVLSRLSDKINASGKFIKKCNKVNLLRKWVKLKSFYRN